MFLCVHLCVCVMFLHSVLFAFSLPVCLPKKDKDGVNAAGWIGHWEDLRQIRDENTGIRMSSMENNLF